MCAIHSNGMSEMISIEPRVCVHGTDKIEMPSLVHFDDNKMCALIAHSNNHICVILVFHSTERYLKSSSLSLCKVFFTVHCNILNIVDLQ